MYSTSLDSYYVCTFLRGNDVVTNGRIEAMGSCRNDQDPIHLVRFEQRAPFRALEGVHHARSQSILQAAPGMHLT